MSRTRFPAADHLHIAVIIPAYNEADMIEGCLEALARQTRLADEVLVIDNNCTDATAQLAARFPFVRVIPEAKQGLIHARNCGFDAVASKADIICRTDADGRPSPEWLSVIEEAFLRQSDLVGLTGPADVYGGLSARLDRYTYNVIHVLTKQLLGGQEYMRGPNTALRGTIWPQLRGEVALDDRLVHEDMDLSVRAAKYGRVAFHPAMRVAVHVRTIRKSPRVAQEYIDRWLRTARYLRRVAKEQ
jgi:glycosyltransferase involved in cell wall biosynthesis